MLDETYIADHTVVGRRSATSSALPPARGRDLRDRSLARRARRRDVGRRRASDGVPRAHRTSASRRRERPRGHQPGAGHGSTRRRGQGLRHDHRSGQRPGRARARTEGGPAPGARDIEDPEHRAFIAEYWGIPEADLPHAGISAVELVHAFREGNVKGLLGLCNNPLVSMPNVDRIAADYDALEFHVQLDFFLSETSERADVVLPSVVWAEDAGVATNAEGGSSCATGPRTRRERQGRTGGSCARSPAGSDTPSGSPSTRSRPSSRSFEERAPVASPTTRG